MAATLIFTQPGPQGLLAKLESEKTLGERLRSAKTRGSFLSHRQQRFSVNGHSCDWVCIIKGTTQGSVGGPYLFTVFLNDLEVFTNSGADMCRFGAGLFTFC